MIQVAAEAIKTIRGHGAVPPEYREMKVEGFPWAGVIMALLLAALMIWAELRGRRNAGEVGSNSAGAGRRENPGAGPSKTIHERDDRT